MECCQWVANACAAEWSGGCARTVGKKAWLELAELGWCGRAAGIVRNSRRCVCLARGGSSDAGVQGRSAAKGTRALQSLLAELPAVRDGRPNGGGGGKGGSNKRRSLGAGALPSLYGPHVDTFAWRGGAALMPISMGGVALYTLEELRESFPECDRPSLETLRRYVRSGSLGGRKIGGNWMVSRAALEAFFKVPPQGSSSVTRLA